MWIILKLFILLFITLINYQYDGSMYMADFERNINIPNADIFRDPNHLYSQGNIYFNSSTFNADFARILLSL